MPENQFLLERLNPIEVVQRDVFPSGHTQMTLIVMYLAVKLKSKNKLFFLIDGIITNSCYSLFALSLCC